MPIVVQKFGGAVLADVEKMKEAAQVILRTKRKGKRLVVVVSAPGDTTDDLITLAKKITETPDKREMDMLLATGEQQSCALLAMILKSMGHKAVSYTGPQVDIVTDSSHTKARIVRIGNQRIKKSLQEGKIVIVAGFQGRTVNEDITTLGRGGSDLTAVALAAFLKAEICEFYKDVKGVFTANPRIVPDARKLDSVSYDEMLEMASMGAQVLNARSVEYAKNYNVPLLIRSNQPGSGTYVTKEAKSMEKVVVSGVAYSTDEAKITIRGVQDRPGLAAFVFKKIAEQDINVDIIVQNTSLQGKTDISFTVPRNELKAAQQITAKVCKIIKAKGMVVDNRVAKVSVIGVGMRSHKGVAAKMFEALAQAAINIDMISTSEIKISCVITENQVKKAVQVIHKKFQLNKIGRS